MASFFCPRPFFFMEFAGTNGDVYACCPSWLKKPSGNLKGNTILEIWNGPHYQEMRESFLRGDWQNHCKGICPELCRYRKSGLTATPTNLAHLSYISPDLAAEIAAKKTILDHPPTLLTFTNSGLCNLKCIMCGWSKVEENTELLNLTYEQLRPLLPKVRELFLTGGGDPFVRPDARAILFGESFDTLKIRLLTNGQLLSRYWDRIKHHNFSAISISIDAATRQTYEKIRRNGKWDRILEALQVVADNGNKFSDAEINMTVMKENYREIPAFVELAKRYGVSAALWRVRPEGDLPMESNFFDNDGETLRDFISVLNQIPPEDTKKTVKLMNLVEYYSR